MYHGRRFCVMMTIGLQFVSSEVSNKLKSVWKSKFTPCDSMDDVTEGQFRSFVLKNISDLVVSCFCWYFWQCYKLTEIAVR